MAKKNIWIGFVFIIFLFIFLGFGLFLSYQKNLYPVLNTTIDKLLKKNDVIIAIDEPITEPIHIASGSIKDTRIFVYRIMDQKVLEFLAPLFRDSYFDETNSFRYLYSEEYKSIKLTGMFQRLEEGFDPLDESIGSWTFAPTIPLTAVSLFHDALVFIDVALSLNIIDIKTGKRIQSFDSPVYPASSAVALKMPLAFSKKNEIQEAVPQYIIKAADGNVYSFAFLDQNSTLDLDGQFAPAFQSIHEGHPFLPTEEIQNSMMQTVANWAQLNETPAFSDPIILPQEAQPLPIHEEGLSIFVCMFSEEGQYIIGMSDEKTNFISADALACLFSEKGELVSVSVDYESHKPQVQMLLEADTLYYLVLANKGEEALKNSYVSYKKIK